MLPAASYRRPPFEPINLADADFGVESTTPLANSDFTQNKFPESIKPKEVVPLLDINFPSNENTVHSILDIIDEYQYLPINSNVPPDSNDNEDILKDLRPDLLESYDSAKESDKNNSIDNVQRLPDVASCPVIITSPDSSKDDCTISSELQSLNTSEICDLEITNPDCSDVELYKCLQEYEEQEALLSVNYNDSSSADVMTPHSEFSDELIAEKPLICDDSLSETKDTLSSETSNDLLSNDDHDESQGDINEQLPLTDEEKVILEEILQDSSNLNVSVEENKIYEQIENESEKNLDIFVEGEVTVKKSQNNLDEYSDIPDLSDVPNSTLELEPQCDEPIQTIKQLTEELLETNSNNEVIIDNNDITLEPPFETVFPPEKEPTESMCSIESTETILLKDENQVSNNTVTDSLDSQSICSLPSEVISNTVESIEESRIQRPSTLDLNGTTNCETELTSTLSTGTFNKSISNSI